MPVTIYELAVHRLREQGVLGPDGEAESLDSTDFDRVGLSLMGRCEMCRATVSAFSSCPSTTGAIRCASGCIDDLGWNTVEEADADNEKFKGRAHSNQAGNRA